MLFALVAGCAREDPSDGLYALVAAALGPEAHLDRDLVVNPLLLSVENPRMTEAALRALGERGVEVMGPEGMEDPGKATLYFTPPEVLDADRYQVVVHVTLGARPGRPRRGDTWWRAVAECSQVCSIVELARTEPRTS